jgi:hypothetical protein
MRRIDEDYQFSKMTISHWFNLLSSLPQFSSERGALFLLYQGAEIIHAFHSLQGIRPDLTGPFSTPAVHVEQMQQREDVDAVFMIEQGLVVYLMAKIQAAFTPEMDILQYLELAQTGLEEEFGRRFYLWPQEFWDKGLIRLFQRIRAVLDEFPPDYICMLTIFEENSIWASLIVQGMNGQIHRITSTKALEPYDVVIADWQSDYPKLLEVVTQKIGPPTLGFFTDDETLRFLLRSQTPLEFIRQARRTNQIIVDPIPGRIRNQL